MAIISGNQRESHSEQKEEITEHVPLQTTGQPYNRSIGAASFTIRNKLVKHRKLEEKQFKFDLSNQVFKKESVNDHHHLSDPTLGNVAFPDQSHEMNEIPREETPLYDTKMEKKHTLENVHRTQIAEETKSTCDNDNKTYASGSQVEKESAMESKQRNSQMILHEKEFKRKSQMNKPSQLNLGKTNKCGVANKVFPSQSQLIEHVRLKNDEKHLQSNKEFKSKVQLTDEEKELTKGGVNNYSINDAPLTIRDQLAILERLQSLDKMYKCDECDRCLKQKGHFIVHQRVHTGEKPFKCDLCDKSYTKKNNLMVHKQSIHSGEKKFACSSCDKSFVQKCHLIIHERMHTGEKPFECRSCSKCFAKKSVLTIHERIHTGEKPFRCDHCLRPFASKSNYTQHLKLHTGEKLRRSSKQCEKNDKVVLM